MRSASGLAGWLLLGLGLVLCYLSPLRPMERLESSMVHRPEGASLGTVLCVHSVFEDGETGWAVAQAMARAGFEARNVALPSGRTFEDYVRLIEDEAERAPGPVYLWGHSMGADLVAAVRGSKIKGRVCAGFPCQAEGRLGVIGAWDQLHSISELDPPVEVLPFADHNGENFDLVGFRAAASHFAGRSLGWADPFWGRALLAVGLLLLMPSLLAATRLPARRRAAVIAPLALALWFTDPLHSVARALVMGWVLASESGHGLRGRQAAAIVLSVALATGVNAWQNWTARPALLLALPIAVALMILQLWMKVSSVLTPLAMVIVVIIETLWPGRILSLLTYLPRTLWLAAPRLRLTVGKVSPAHGALLLLLLLACGLAWKQVLDAGYAPDPSQWAGLLTRLGCLIVLPFMVYLALARRWASGIDASE